MAIWAKLWLCSGPAAGADDEAASSPDPAIAPEATSIAKASVVIKRGYFFGTVTPRIGRRKRKSYAFSVAQDPRALIHCRLDQKSCAVSDHACPCAVRLERRSRSSRPC